MSPKSDRTARYREMRDFAETPEPKGATRAGEDQLRFVIQQHDATRLHWDLRLEHDGALASWAMPRGLPWSPDDNHLAVHTEDHPLEYLTFHGEIPEGQYGAGSMTIWDEGTYEPHEWTDKKATVTLHGEHADGKYALFQTRGRDWMIHRMDPPLDPDREPIPEGLAPMTAMPGHLPRNVDQFSYELWWPGCRALILAEVGRVGIVGAGGEEIGAKFPEVRRISRALGYTEAVLDCVLVGIHDGAPDPESSAVNHRLAVKADSTIRKLTTQEPVAAMLFDLLWLDGHPVMDQPWEERRSLLEDLGLEADAWQTPGAHRGDGKDLLHAAGEAGLPGLIAKKLDSRYRPGKESKDWREVRGVSDVLDELYEAPFEEFVARRKELVARLRADGDREGAKEVAAVKKPTVAAWALNQLRLTAPDDVKDLEALHADVAEGGHDLQDLLERRRRVVGALDKAASKVLREAGRSPSSFDRDISGTLEAAVVDADALQALTGGRLTRTLSPPGLEAFAATPVAKRPARKAEKAPPERDDAKRRKATERVEAAERELDVAETRLAEAERLRERADEALETARQSLADLDG